MADPSNADVTLMMATNAAEMTRAIGALTDVIKELGGELAHLQHQSHALEEESGGFFDKFTLGFIKGELVTKALEKAFDALYDTIKETVTAFPELIAHVGEAGNRFYVLT